MIDSAPAAAPSRSRLRDNLGRILFGFAAVFLAVGAMVFLVSVFREPAATGPLPPAPVFTRKPVSAKIDPAARRVAGKFILTAVARKDVASSWALVAPSLRAGYTKKQWATGDIPVTPFPVQSIDEARFAVRENAKNAILLEVALIPKPGAEVPATVFQLGLKARGEGANRRWLVDYWMPRYTPPVPDNPDR